MELLPAVKELPPVRGKGAPTQKLIIPMTAHAKPGVPARDRPGRAPPMPQDVNSGGKVQRVPRLEGENDYLEDDPVWLKDKADTFMSQGNYNDAYTAYTKALTEFSNARAFCNRALCNMYLGKLEACIEDCSHGLRILEHKFKVPPGNCPPPRDPEDERLKARGLVRRGVAHLWLGDFQRAEEDFRTALDECAEHGLDRDEREAVQADLTRIHKAVEACAKKRAVDKVFRNVSNADELEQNRVVNQYDECFNIENGENAVVCANRSFCKLQMGDLSGCLEDAEISMKKLGQWPVARNAPKRPERPTRLDPPTLEDHTFRNPHKKKEEDEKDWLMKHSGSGQTDTSQLPPIPPDFEWMKDMTDKNDDSWIAVRKKLTREQIESIRAKIGKLQEALYTRNLEEIDAAVKIAGEQNAKHDGPSNEAIRQAIDYRRKLEEYYDEEAQKLEEKKKTLDKEFENANAEQDLSIDAERTAPGCFQRAHPVEKTRRRLFVKCKLREAKACELKADTESAIKCLRSVLKVEPKNKDAESRLAILEATSKALVDKKNEVLANENASTDAESATETESTDKKKKNTSVSDEKPQAASPSTEMERAANDCSADNSTEKKKKRKTHVTSVDNESDDEESDDEEDQKPKNISINDTQTLIATGTKYLEKGEFDSAHQLFVHVLRKGTFVEPDSTKNTSSDIENQTARVRVLLNACMCLQKTKRAKDLLGLCAEALTEVEKMKNAWNADGSLDLSENKEMRTKLFRFEAACLTRRSWAHNQLNNAAAGTRDAKAVQEILRQVK